MTTRIHLFFSRDQILALERVRFSHEQLGSERLAIRGKLGGAWGSQFTFQWTPAVQALVMLLLSTRLNRSDDPAILAGGAGTPAASLDYAIGKQPAWLLDIFGLDAHGVAIVRRLIRRTNPERKRGGDVVLSINPRHLAGDQIRISINGTEITAEGELVALRAEIEAGWRPNRPPLSVHTGRTRTSASPAAPAAPRLLVTAFSGTDGKSAAWGEWVAGNLARELAAEPTLRVVSGQALIEESDRQVPPAILGTRLRCATVLFGHIQVSGAEVRIAMQLVATDSGEVVWSYSTAAIEPELPAMILAAVRQITGRVTGGVAAAA